MTEQIGKITLDYKYYPGEDLYCDGVIEDEILDIVKNNPPSEFPRIIEERASWPILYHLSPLRENIVDWVPFDKSMKVLEVGSGCGAITGAFSRKAGTVTSVDLSKKRSLINAYRHQECDNVTIKLGNFKDIEPELDNDYDYIFLIGVFEYGQGYMGSDTPYEDFMAILKKHMKADGRLVIAIENKFGLKYWAGCKEDHYGTYFSGIEDYPDGGGVRTFTRRGLERIMEKNGVQDYSFYYPYPDYKFMTSVYSDAYLPQIGELSNNLRNFDRDRLQLFDEKNAFDNIIREGMFDEYSNSYMLIIGAPIPIKYAKYSNDRTDRYAIRTDICQDEAGNRSVYKTACNEAANAHIAHIHTAYEQLSKRFEGGRFQINRCELCELNQGNNSLENSSQPANMLMDNGQKNEAQLESIALEYLTGKTLEACLDECLDRNDEAGFRALIEEYMQAIQYHDDMEVHDLDLIFSNIIVQGSSWTIIDYEWTFEKQISYEKILFRAFYCYLVGAEKRRKPIFALMEEKLGIKETDIQAHVQEEIEFQRFVTGNRKSMTEIHTLIGRQVIPAKAVADIYVRQVEARKQKHVQVYLDRGNGFHEEDSYFLTDEQCMDCGVLEDTTGQKKMKFTIQIPQDVVGLRLDPYTEPCMVKIHKLQCNGDSVSYESNGNTMNCQESQVLLFNTSDPNMTILLQNHGKAMAATDTIAQKQEPGCKQLEVELDVQPLSMEMTSILAENLQKSKSKSRFNFFK